MGYADILGRHLKPSEHPEVAYQVHSEIASRAHSDIVLASLLTMNLLSAPPNLVFYSIVVLGIVQYSTRRIRKKIEGSFVPIADPSYQKLLSEVAREEETEDVELLVLDSSAPNAFTFSRGPRHYVAVTIAMLEILEADELRSVFAHEIAHIKNKDCRIKIIGLIVRSQYFYLPLVFLIVKAIFRRREYLADETAAALEQSPLPLMSALLKVSEYLRSFSASADLFLPATSFAFAQRPTTGLRRILSSTPTVEDRITNLMKLSA
jgi:Zn-dependent protease with chaperone function